MKKRRLMAPPDESKFNPGVKPTDINCNIYCGSCSNYPNSKGAMMSCPFKEIINERTSWQSIGCSYYSN